jgi:hypothetical protein
MLEHSGLFLRKGFEELFYFHNPKAGFSLKCGAVSTIKCDFNFGKIELRIKKKCPIC